MDFQDTQTSQRITGSLENESDATATKELKSACVE